MLMKKNEYGFGAIGILIILVLAAIAGSGWLVLQNSKKAKSTASSDTNTTADTTPAKQTTDPYVGWKSYSLKFEKASFKYPSTWQIKDTSAADVNTKGGGIDVITLLGSNGFEMSIADGGPNDYGFPMGGLTSVHTDPVTFLGKPAYMNLAQIGSSNTGIVDKINLTATKNSLTDFPEDKNVIAPTYQRNTENKFLILIDYNANVDFNSASPAYVHLPLATVLKDSNYLDAKLVIDSFTY
jgi:hypothetical protein